MAVFIIDSKLKKYDFVVTVPVMKTHMQPSMSICTHRRGLLLHQLVDPFAKLPGEGGEGNPMGLSFPTFPLVVGPGFGVQTQLGQRQLKERLPQRPTVAASALSIDPALSGLPHGGSKATVGSISIVALEPVYLTRPPSLPPL